MKMCIFVDNSVYISLMCQTDCVMVCVALCYLSHTNLWTGVCVNGVYLGEFTLFIYNSQSVIKWHIIMYYSVFGRFTFGFALKKEGGIMLWWK